MPIIPEKYESSGMLETEKRHAIYGVKNLKEYIRTIF
jgi:hypothetical protein